MKFVTLLVLIVIAVGIFAIAGNTKKEETYKPSVTDIILSDPNNRQ
jgi:hypothetical protein